MQREQPGRMRAVVLAVLLVILLPGCATTTTATLAGHSAVAEEVSCRPARASDAKAPPRRTASNAVAEALSIGMGALGLLLMAAGMTP